MHILLEGSPPEYQSEEVWSSIANVDGDYGHTSIYVSIFANLNVGDRSGLGSHVP